MQVLSELPTIRRDLRRSDPEAIVELHDRVYRPEYGMNAAFTASVASSVRAAIERGWPTDGGAAWLIDGKADGSLAGSIALTLETPLIGRVRWFVFEPELRGRGLGRQLLGELLAEARVQGARRLELETFSALRAAARIYLSVGFQMTASRERDDWGPPIIYQRYALELSASPGGRTS
jgi:GNAT superfamily N-acetyltransferase